MARALVLVVGDEALVRMGYRLMLEAWGHEVLDAASGAEAARRLDLDGRVPDLVVADYRLRDGETGADVIRALRARFGHLPALVATGDTDPERLREADASGSALLHKPVPEADLRQAVAGLLAGDAPGRPRGPRETVGAVG